MKSRLESVERTREGVCGLFEPPKYKQDVSLFVPNLPFSGLGPSGYRFHDVKNNDVTEGSGHSGRGLWFKQ